jgi:hypothetical protein
MRFSMLCDLNLKLGYFICLCHLPVRSLLLQELHPAEGSVMEMTEIRSRINIDRIHLIG